MRDKDISHMTVEDSFYDLRFPCIIYYGIVLPDSERREKVG